jgi:hypothetical protein
MSWKSDFSARSAATATEANAGQLGGTTAAAGTNSGNAAVLPAGTARDYPVTGADGTKGVRVNAADLVTNRRLRVLNGVANAVLKIYPPPGGTINGAAADAAVSTPSGLGLILYCSDAANNVWYAY